MQNKFKRFNKIAGRNLSQLPETIQGNLRRRVERKLVERNILDNDLVSPDAIDDITSLLNWIDIGQAVCAYCNDPIRTKEDLPLDRVDNYKGYSLGNVVFSCTRCNFQKGSRTLNEFLLTVEKVYKNLGDKDKAKQSIDLTIKNTKDNVETLKKIRHGLIPIPTDWNIPERIVQETSPIPKDGWDRYAEQIFRAIKDNNFNISDTLEYLRNNVIGPKGERYAWDYDSFLKYLRGKQGQSFADRILNQPNLVPSVSQEEKIEFRDKFMKERYLNRPASVSTQSGTPPNPIQDENSQLLLPLSSTLNTIAHYLGSNGFYKEAAKLQKVASFYHYNKDQMIDPDLEAYDEEIYTGEPAREDIFDPDIISSDPVDYGVNLDSSGEVVTEDDEIEYLKYLMDKLDEEQYAKGDLESSLEAGERSE